MSLDGLLMLLLLLLVKVSSEFSMLNLPTAGCAQPLPLARPARRQSAAPHRSSPSRLGSVGDTGASELFAPLALRGSGRAGV